MNSDDAWSLLGIARDADADTVRRAYARRLKVVRPDGDPAAFQALVAARDVALAVAALPRPAPPPERDRPEPPQTDAPQADPPKVETPPVEPPPAPAGVTEVADPMPAPVIPARPAPTPPPRLEARPLPAPGPLRIEPEPQPDADARRAVQATLGRIIAPDRRHSPSIEEWQRLLVEVGALGLADRALVQRPIIRALRRFLMPRSPDPPRRYEPTSFSPVEDAAVRAVMLGFDAEFSWHQGDAAIFRALPDRDDGRDFVRQLAAIRHADAVRRGRAPAEIPATDFEDLFRAAAPIYRVLAAGGRARRSLRLRAGMIVSAPIHAMIYRHDRFVVWWAATSAFTLSAQAATRGLPPSIGLATTAAGGLAWLASVVWYGFNAERCELAAGRRAVRRADRLGVFDPDRRSSYLRSITLPRAPGLLAMLAMLITIGVVVEAVQAASKLLG